MSLLTRPRPGEEWFAVVADGQAAVEAARVLGARAAQTVAHASGLPWLLGHWRPETVVTAAVGQARAAVIGRSSITAAELARRLTRIKDLDGAESLAQGVAGSFHLVVSIGGRVRTRGSASAVRQVFHARMAGVTVACSRADVLARATGDGIDEQALAARLLVPAPPYPLDQPCVWRSVDRLPPQDCLIIDGDGRARTRRWWHYPEPALPLEEAAPAVRQALAAAVDTAVAAGGTVSVDLSGGMDSTSLCFLAAAGPADLVTTHWQPLDAANDDTAWAHRAAEALPHARHLIAEPGPTPLWFAEMTSVPPGDEPGGCVRDWGRLRDLVERMRGQGSRLHLVGGGSDELFTAHPSSLHDLARTRPLAAVARLRATRAPSPLWSQLAQLADRTGFAAWLNGFAAGLTTQQPPLAKAEAEIFAMSWGTPSRLPAWATEQATHATRELAARLAAAATPPLWPRRGQHVAVHTARASGAGLRQIDQATTAAGLPFAAPFLDDAVITAALSVRVTDRSAPGRAKPVLAEAMRPIVPGSLLDRPKTGEYSAELYAGLRRHQGELLELTDDSRLARMGLIDAAALRAFLLRPHPRPYALVPLFSTLACELWLRAQPTGGPPAASGEPA